MTERTPWWKAFLPKKKSKDHSIGPDFDPWAPHPDKAREPAPPPKSEGEQRAGSTPSDNTALNDDTYDDSHMESVFNEHTCRRKMRVSRSGRFKEKNRIRQSLPIQDNKDSAAKEDMR